MDIKAILAKISSNTVVSTIVNDFHIPIALFVFIVTTVYHFYTHQDLGPNYIESIKYFYGFLALHAGAYQIWPDKDKQDGN